MTKICKQLSWFKKVITSDSHASLKEFLLQNTLGKDRTTEPFELHLGQVSVTHVHLTNTITTYNVVRVKAISTEGSPFLCLWS